jgi:hypothetical protein
MSADIAKELRTAFGRWVSFDAGGFDYEWQTAPVAAKAADEIERLRAAYASAQSFIADGECTCLPHAQPGDGTMCPRCEWLAGAS